MPSIANKKDLKKIEKKKALIRKFNKFLKDNFKWLIIAAVLFIFASSYIYVLKPKYDKTKKTLEITNQQREDDYNSRKKDLEKITGLLLTYSKVGSAYKEKIASIAPKSIDQIFTEINQIISKNGLLVQSLTVSEVDVRDPKAKKKTVDKNYLASGDLGKIRVDISVKGVDYEAFKNLLRALENNLRLIDVEGLSFDPLAKTSSLMLSLYYTK